MGRHCGERGDAAFRRALELNPNSAFAHWTYGYYLGNIGRFEESTAHNDQAIDLDPLWVNPHQGKAAFAYFEHKDEEALAGHLRALELDPSYALANVTVGIVYCRLGRVEEGISALRRGDRLSGSSLFASVLVNAYVQQGQWADARAMIDELHKRAEAGYVSPIAFVWAYAAVGDLEPAFRYLEEAYTERAPMCFSAWSYDGFDPLRGDPRFDDFLRRMHFPETARSSPT